MNHPGNVREKAVGTTGLQFKGEFAEAFPVLRELRGELSGERYVEPLGVPEVVPKT